MTIITLAAGRPAGVSGIIFDVMDDHEVEPAVPIVIDKAARRAPAGVLNPGSLRQVLEGAIAPVAEQPAATILGNINVNKTVVIDVADGHSHAITGDVET